MSDTPDFYTRATDQLRSAAGDDMVVLVTLNGERMHMQTRAPRGPKELVHVARRLLEEARDQFAEAEAEAPNEAAEQAAAHPKACIECALAELAENDDDDEEG